MDFRLCCIFHGKIQEAVCVYVWMHMYVYIFKLEDFNTCRTYIGVGRN